MKRIQIEVPTPMDVTIVSISASAIKYLLMEGGFLMEDAELCELLMELEVEEK